MNPTQLDAGAAEPVNRPNAFDGDVRMQALNRPHDHTGVELLAVYFAAGARTRAHTHTTEQVLHVLDGEGVLATETERTIIRVGDVVVVPADVWHWHGATPDSAMTHMSIKPLGETDWDVDQKNWARYMEI